MRLRVDAQRAQAGVISELAGLIRDFPGEAPVFVDLDTSLGPRRLELGPATASRPRRTSTPRSSTSSARPRSCRHPACSSPRELDGLWSPRPALPEHRQLRPSARRRPSTALQEALDEWRDGRTSWEGWTESVGRAHGELRPPRGRRPEDVAAGATVSELVGLVAASLPDGARVLVPDVEFTSNLFPWLAQEHRGVEVRTTPLGSLADSIGATTDARRRQRRPVVERRRRRPRRRSARRPRRAARSSSSTRPRPAAGSRSTQRPLRLRRRAHVQVADVAARSGADGSAARAARGR